jgi:glutamate racemase
MDDRPIGVFDSGVGGLTVVRALIEAMPSESIVYFGDSARTPYGPRRPDEVRQFAAEIATFLVDEGAKMLVVACNSMSSAGLDDVRARYPELPVVEVIEPAVLAAARATRNQRVGVIGTELTIASGAYDRAFAAVAPEVEVHSAACPLFVKFAERGQDTGSELMVAQDYLYPLKQAGVDTLVLGCTHYPLLAGVIQFVMTLDVVLISSADAVAHRVFTELDRLDLWRRRDAGTPTYRFACSGDPAQFEQVGRKFLGPAFASVEARSLGAGHVRNAG